VTALVLPDGRYAVVVSETRPGDVFVSKSLDGPWTQLARSRWTPTGSTPGRQNVECERDGSPGRRLRDRGEVRRDLDQQERHSGPYKLQGHSIYPGLPGLPTRNLERSVIWYSGGLYHIVVNCFSDRKAFDLTSADGINNWTNRGWLRSDHGHDSLYGRNREPLEQHGASGVFLENGHVAYFTFACWMCPRIRNWQRYSWQ